MFAQKPIFTIVVASDRLDADLKARTQGAPGFPMLFQFQTVSEDQEPPGPVVLKVVRDCRAHIEHNAIGVCDHDHKG